ncbi:glycosyl transferase [Candidatus Thiomargarita nelsonii]|uniref:Glycosyl transferase n=1 Tax=Candidatus Thiomargarita nelsonii TaxID=1003181 RepID=A0A0A6S6A5_9GAMM|nr:glycosyl transferase [Candidatus Thiomargarita nelsonii]
MIKKTVTIVIPVFNEGGAIEKHLPVIFENIKEIKEINIGVLLVDDGSTDNTVEKLKKLCERYNTLNFICLNRNFGKEAAIHAGLQQSHDDAVIVMDSDLQHPPQLIGKMIALWRQGIDVVEAYKVYRGKESYLSRLMAHRFYDLFGILSGMNIKNHSDFKLLDRKVVEAYCAMPEKKRFFRGIIHWLGFSSAQIPFEVPERQHGVTAWSRFKLFKFSFTALTSFSTAPLQIITFLGVLCFIISFIIGSLALYHKYMGSAVSGFTTVILLILIIGSLLMIALGVIGIYIAHIYDEVKRRPDYLIDWKRSHLNKP